jgi:hypothetical protein
MFIDHISNLLNYYVSNASDDTGRKVTFNRSSSALRRSFVLSV